jgi:hypothetical protein
MTRRHLFLDLDEVGETHNLVQHVVEATKHPANPLLPLGDIGEWDSLQARPWEGRTVLYDAEDRLFKCWYAGSDLTNDRWWALGYAVSTDGIVWEKPRLGLFDYNGSRDNNITCLAYGPVIKDPADPDPRRRYKMIGKGPVRENGAPVSYSLRGNRVFHSPDGIHWEEHHRVDLPEWRGGAPDMVALLRDDQDPSPERRYKIVWQVAMPATKPGPARVRTKWLACGPDLERLSTTGVSNPILHPNDGNEQENHFLALVPYEGHYVMPYEYGWYAPNGRGTFGAYCADIRLAVSRDGLRYRRLLPHQPILRRGAHGTWDDGFLVIADKAIVKDDTIYLYYCGNGEEWTSWPKVNIPSGTPLKNTGAIRLSRMGLATLRLDGFVCLETPDRETSGWVTTLPVEPPAGQLVVNVDATHPGRSWLEVEALHPDRDEPLPGFTRETCDDVCRDGVRLPVRWRDAALEPGHRLRLRFWLHGAARLFSYSVAE